MTQAGLPYNESWNGFSQGQRLKREGQETVAAKNEKFVFMMREAAKMHSTVWGSVTTDDLRKIAVSAGMYPTHHNCWGSILKGKGWTVIGRQASKLPGNHGRELKVWKWVGSE